MSSTSKAEHASSTPPVSQTSAALRPRPTTAVEGGLAVIGAGFGRTGTSSLQEALEILGFGPCYHMREIFKAPSEIDKWDRIGQGKRDVKDYGGKNCWDDVFFGYKSTVDLPSAAHYKEICDYYPKAKVILTVRDENRWADSMLETIAGVTPFWEFIFAITFVSTPKLRRFDHNNIWKDFCGKATRDKETLIEAFRRHNEDVKKTIPAEKLLVMDVKEGWGKLCEFLNVPVPDQPFPKTWEAAEFKKMIVKRKMMAVLRLFLSGTLIAGAVVLAGEFLQVSRQKPTK